MSIKKRAFYFFCACCLLFSLVGCGKKEDTTLGDGMFLMLSSTVKGEAVETYEMYTLHAEISDNGNVRIYADDFNRWVPSDPCPEETVQLSADTIQQIKDIIDDIDLYHMRRNIGSRDLKDGEYKELTLYTASGEHVSGGLNPSNREFLKLYDYVEDQIREVEYRYRTKIAEMQKKAISMEQNKNVYITDSQEETIVAQDEINDVYVTCGAQHTRYEETATADAEEPVNYYVTFLLADAGAEALRADTKSCNEDNAMYYKVYQDNAYAFTFCVQEPVMTTEIYVYETMDAEEAVAKAKELRDSLY